MRWKTKKDGACGKTQNKRLWNNKACSWIEWGWRFSVPISHFLDEIQFFQHFCYFFHIHCSVVPPATFPATAASTIGYATSAKQSDKSRSWGSIKKMNKWKWYQAHDNRTSDNRFYGGLAPFSPFYSIDFASSWGLQPPRNRNALKRRSPFSWEKKHRRRKHKAKRWNTT